MATRYNYNINSEFHHDVDLHQLIPLAMFETVPGETWTGRLRFRGFSAALSEALLNRVYIDYACFYVPWRIVWNLWPNFITQSVALTGQDQDVETIPTEPPSTTLGTYTSGTLKWIYGKQPTYGVKKIITLPVRAYNLIWNTYYRDEEQSRIDEDALSIRNVPVMGRTFHERLLYTKQEASEAIPTGTMDDLRESLGKESFRRARDLYGEQYGDYLRQLGVQSGWQMTEPELLQSGTTECRFVLTGNTAQTTGEQLGEKGGFYQWESETSLKKTFTPEHGIIMCVAAWRMQMPVSGNSHPLWAKNRPDQFWNPQHQVVAVDPDDIDVTTLYHRNDTAANAPNMDLPPEKYLDYKIGGQYTTGGAHVTAGGVINQFYATRAAPAGTDTFDAGRQAVLYPTATDFANVLSDELACFGGHVTQCSMQKRSPISRSGVDPLRIR